MTATSLTLTAPQDLSVGTIFLKGPESFTFMVTPSSRELLEDAIEPGIYSAVVEALGLRPRTFIFQVEPGKHNFEKLPPLSFLASGPQQMSGELKEVLARVIPTEASVAAARGSLKADLEIRGSQLAPSDSSSDSQLEPSSVAPALSQPPQRKSIWVGVSEDHHPYRDSGWRPYRLEADILIESIDGRLELVIPRPEPLPGPSSGARLRLLLALGSTRLERAMVPLYRGGTRVIFMASQLSEQDLEMFIFPADTVRRAMAQALRAGVESDAAAVATEYMAYCDRTPADDQRADPWTMTLAALLAVRFPSVFPQTLYGVSSQLADEYPWLPDIHILRGRDALMTASSHPKSQSEAAELAIMHFRQAKKGGMPYFSYSNELAMELLGALSGMEFPEQTRNDIKWLRERWTIDDKIRKAGVSMSWAMPLQQDARVPELTADQLFGRESVAEALGDPVDIEPSRSVLDPRYISMVYSGQLSAGSITPSGGEPGPVTGQPLSRERDTFASASAERPQSTRKRSMSKKTRKAAPRGQHDKPSEPPALSRPITEPDDLNKGRFGGESEVDGFRLEASFELSGSQDWVKITIQVAAVAGQQENFDRVVEIFLHDTFRNHRIRTYFRGEKASVCVYAWGGFTVGAWLPVEQVELELDLARVPGAPRVIREL